MTPSIPPMPPELARLLPELEDALFAFVFGSFGSERFGPESDLDLAVRFPGPLSFDDRLDLATRLSGVARRTVDLVDLASADPIIAMQVLRTGRPILVRDRLAFETFRMTTPSRYFDWKITRHPVEEALFREAASR